MNSEDRVIELLKKQSNGVKLKVEEDPDGFMCIGINLVKYYPNGALIREHETCTDEQALKWTNQKLYKNVYPDVQSFCQRHHVPKEIYEALCVFSFNEGAHHIKTIPFIVCLVNKRWFDLSRIILGNFNHKEQPHPAYYSDHKLMKRKIEIDNFKHLIERTEGIN